MTTTPGLFRGLSSVDHKTARGLAALTALCLLWAPICVLGQPFIGFNQSTDGQVLVSFAGLAGTLDAGTGSVAQVTFSMYNQSLGQWWNGTTFQGSEIWLPADVSGTNWTPAAGLQLPNPCCGETYQLGASITDSATNVFTTNILVQADALPPSTTFTPLTNGQTVSDLSALGGTVTDNFDLTAQVAFTIHELDINGSPGRWWNGTNFQADAVLLPAVFDAGNWSPAPGLALPMLNSGQAYELTVTATDSTSNSAATTITITAAIQQLAWDPGQTPLGTLLLQNPNTNGGNYYFQIIPQSPAVGVWRTALHVSSGEADVYLSYNAPPASTNSYGFGSARLGSDGFVVDASQFSPGQTWYILVHATPDAQWNLVTGDAFVYDLGPLAADASSGTNVTVGAEGMAFFKTTIPANTLAWRLWLNGAPNTLFVKKSAAPDPASYELIQDGQMLVVPPYLAGATFNGTYFIGVVGAPGAALALDSRRHEVTDLAFSSLTNVVVPAGDFPYRTYRVQVPVQQIAWQLNLLPTQGLPNLSVRRDLVPNEFRNDAFSETPTNVGASVTLVPPPPQSGAGVPGLSDGTWYVTVYSTASFACGFTNLNPVITDVPYVFSATNDAPTRAGWRYYRVVNIAEQLGSLGWQLLLANQVPGTEIALRRNAVPGRWNQRMADDNYAIATQGYVDCLPGSQCPAVNGFLQNPGHQADIWYIGVYTPDQALGNFVLSGSLLTAPTVAFDSTGSSVNVADAPSGLWNYFQIDVPTNALGWDVRLVNVTSGSPRLVVRRDLLPDGLITGGTWGYYQDPWDYTTWASGNEWLSGAPYYWPYYLPIDWTGDWFNPDGSDAHVNTLAMGLGNPLEPGTYYLGVYASGNSSYTVQSRGIGEGLSLPVQDLDFATGSLTNTLPAREAAYYRVTIASNTPSWQVKLSPIQGDALLLVQKDALPNIVSGGSVAPPNGWINGGMKMQKVGNERFVLLPPSGQTSLEAGTYYLAVVSEGVNPDPAQQRIGSGSSDCVLQSLGPLPIGQIGTLGAVGAPDLVLHDTAEAGQVKAYQFAVPPDTLVVELRLTNLQGHCALFMIWDTNVPAAGGYGLEGGQGPTWQTSGDIVTLPNPAPGTYTVLAQVGTDQDAAFEVRLRARQPDEVAFDGGNTSVAAQPNQTWRYFTINVPTNALGWDVRLVNVTSGSPRLVVRRDLLPDGLYTAGTWGYYQDPWDYATWPSGNEWLSGAPYYWPYYLPIDWTGDWVNPDGSDAHVNTLAMGMGNPLEPGTYYLGVYANGESSYTVQSRGIGEGLSLLVQELDFATGSLTNTLPAREAAYYRLTIASNTPSWKVRLATLSGEALLLVQRDALPNIVSGGTALPAPGWIDGGKKMQKAGNEHYVLLPPDGQTSIPAGNYFLAVVSEGVNPDPPQRQIGNGSSQYVLQSQGILPVLNLGTVALNSDLVWSNALEGGEVAAYQFSVAPNTPTLEARLEDRVGNPALSLISGAALPRPPDDSVSAGTAYGLDGGYITGRAVDYNLLTVPNPATSYSLLVQAVSSYADATYTLRVRAPMIPQLNLSTDSNGNGQSNSVSGLLADNQRAYYQVLVSDTVGGAPVLGWKLDLVSSNGAPTVRVRRNLLPDDSGACDMSPFNTPTATIVPPYLTPGVWYVEVKGQGATSFTLTSSVVTTNTLRHPLWVMPAVGQTNVAPGLISPAIGDSGIDPGGAPILDPQAGTVTDQGVDLKQGQFDYYAVLVPNHNAGLLRTELDAISGNPKLYLRLGSAPTLAHFAGGSYDQDCYYQTPLYDRSMTGSGTQYGNWVPLNGRSESQLSPGLWVLAVQASGNANVRYRLRLTCGNAAPNQLVQDLALAGGSLTNQSLIAGDWRYYRVQIPDPAPANWLLTWTRSLGSARLFVRDTVPPGDTAAKGDYSSQNPIDWSTDSKNQGPYPRFDTPGTDSLSTPPLRPGHVYYLGIWSPNDTTFALSSATSGGSAVVTNSLAFYGGTLNRTLPASGSALYRMDVPPEATRLLFTASNSTNVVLTLEQGTLALADGPAHWSSHPWWGPQADVSFDQVLNVPNNWPWLSGYTYYLMATNTSSQPETFSLASFGRAAATVPPSLRGGVSPEGSFSLSVSGQLGNYYIVQASTNLLDWTGLCTNTASFQFQDTDSTNFPMRFYRTVLAP